MDIMRKRKKNKQDAVKNHRLIRYGLKSGSVVGLDLGSFRSTVQRCCRWSFGRSAGEATESAGSLRRNTHSDQGRFAAPNCWGNYNRDLIRDLKNLITCCGFIIM